MKINRALNLVIPIDSEKGQLFVHSTPISREIFEQYFLVISKTFAAIFSEGLGAIAGTVAVTATYPTDLIRRLLQLSVILIFLISLY